MSPRLFVIAIKPLAEMIRQDSEIKGVKGGQTTHTINVMADDVVLYLTNLFDSLAKLKAVLYTFRSVSG